MIVTRGGGYLAKSVGWMLPAFFTIFCAIVATVKGTKRWKEPFALGMAVFMVASVISVSAAEEQNNKRLDFYVDGVLQDTAYVEKIDVTVLVIKKTLTLNEKQVLQGRYNLNNLLYSLGGSCWQTQIGVFYAGTHYTVPGSIEKNDVKIDGRQTGVKAPFDGYFGFPTILELLEDGKYYGISVIGGPGARLDQIAESLGGFTVNSTNEIDLKIHTAATHVAVGGVAVDPKGVWIGEDGPPKFSEQFCIENFGQETVPSSFTVVYDIWNGNRAVQIAYNAKNAIFTYDDNNNLAWALLRQRIPYLKEGKPVLPRNKDGESYHLRRGSTSW